MVSCFAPIILTRSKVPSQGVDAVIYELVTDWLVVFSVGRGLVIIMTCLFLAVRRFDLGFFIFYLSRLLIDGFANELMR